MKAFDNPSGDLFKLSDEMIKTGLKASRKSDRKRIILPLHRTQQAEVQRLVNFMQPGTYITPHKHPLPHAIESIVLLQGQIRFFTFDDNGNVLTDQTLISNPVPDILDIEPNTWHSFVVRKSDTILFECKKGPYNAETDKKFAEWAPKEGDPDVAKWMDNLK